jgi:protein-L-isoaspartate(D-aspartate) O-methyltransferase
LEIGAGSGYQTAILSRIAGQIYAVERVSILVREAQEKFQRFNIKNVTLACADGSLGWQAHAPFDAILVAAGSPTIPQPLLNQLKIGGRLVLPVGADQKTQKLIRVTRAERNFTTEDFGACAFVPLIGEHGWQND